MKPLKSTLLALLLGAGAVFAEEPPANASSEDGIWKGKMKGDSGGAVFSARLEIEGATVAFFPERDRRKRDLFGMLEPRSPPLLFGQISDEILNLTFNTSGQLVAAENESFEFRRFDFDACKLNTTRQCCDVSWVLGVDVEECSSSSTTMKESPAEANLASSRVGGRWMMKLKEGTAVPVEVRVSISRDGHEHEDGRLHYGWVSIIRRAEASEKRLEVPLDGDMFFLGRFLEASRPTVLTGDWSQGISGGPGEFIFTTGEDGLFVEAEGVGSSYSASMEQLIPLRPWKLRRLSDCENPQDCKAINWLLGTYELNSTPE